MDKETIIKAIKELRQKSPKRNFSQTFDLVIQLQDIDLKKQEQKIDAFITLPHTLGKKLKICGLVKQLKEKSQEAFDETIAEDDFVRYTKDKKLVKKLATTYDYFVAQADLMGRVATVFGKVLGPKGKMPSPKAGCVVPTAIPTLKPLADKLQKTVKIQTKNELAIKAPVGKDTMKDDELADNIEAIYNAVLKLVPHEKNNIKQVMLKLTMGQLYIIGKGFAKPIEEKNE